MKHSAAAVAVAFCTITSALHGQVVQPPPPPPGGLPPGVQQQVLRPGRDTARLLDSIRGKTELVNWAPADSVLLSLLSRDGRTVTRFQGDSISIDAVSGRLRLMGTPAAVTSDEATIIGDSIIYNDSTEIITVFGRDSIVLRDPSRHQGSDVKARGVMSYDMLHGRTEIQNVATGVVENGELMLLNARKAVFIADAASERRTIYGHYGSITSCDDPNPHYHIETKWFKMIAGRLLVARPAVFYIADVPVFMLPFIVNDLRQGRRSGILTPRFGLSDVVANSSNYTRNVENVGIYWATSDYMDVRAWLDWRSSSSAELGDPGWIKYTGEIQYKWLDRFLSGRLGLSHGRQGNGFTNTQISLSHAQEFSSTRRLSADLNYATSTTVQQRQEVIAARELATIRSRFNYSHVAGPFSISLGGARTQYPGQELVDQTLPTLSVSSKAIEFTPWLSLTPSLQMNNTQRFNVERTGPLSFRYFTLPSGLRDSLRISGSSRNSTASLDLPLTLGKVRWQNSFQLTDVEDDFPQIFTVRDVNDTTISQTRVYPRTFKTELDWRTNVSVPASFLTRTLNLTPSFSITNVHPGPFWVRSERSFGEFVSQSKRPQFGLSASPTIYGLFPGFGPFSRLRHAIEFRMGYSYAPAADVSDEYLTAIGTTRQGYLGSLRQSAVSFGMDHVFAARIGADSASGREGREVRLLALNLTPITWDFELAKARGGTGIASDRFGVTARSDLLPGLDFSADYSLFQGNLLSDSAVFKPFLTGLRTSVSFSNTSNPFATILGIFTGRRPAATAATGGAPLAPAQLDPALTPTQSTSGGQLSGPPSPLAYQRVESFSMRLDFTLSRQRPPVGDVIIIENDARARCTIYDANPFLYDQCVREFEALSLADPNAGERPPGGAFIRQPTRSALAGTIAAPLTKNWSASWSTSYDFEAGDFASHMVDLRRNMHDWEANFSFSKSPSGNFMFSFLIQLKAQNEVKFDYRDASYTRSGG